MKNVNKIQVLFLLILILYIFRSWFLPGILTGGDFGILYQSMYHNFLIVPYAWSQLENNGFGGFVAPFLWISMNAALPVTLWGTLFHFSWGTVERLGFFYPFLLLGTVSPFILIRYILPQNNLKIFGVIIYLFNTYILMVIGGGQVAIALSYAIAPLTLFLFIKAINFALLGVIKRSVISKGIVLVSSVAAVQILFDTRIALVTLCAAGLYWLISLLFLQSFSVKKVIYSFLVAFIVPGLIIFLLHAFWLLPTIIHHQNPLVQLGQAYTSVGAAQYFSFATFENSLALLHPNWPENIFGMTHFMRPEFFILSLLAFSSLLFVTQKRKESKYIIFFTLLSLVGAFLAKGTNDPFGSLYLWLFSHLPGFGLFRDASKWYLLIAISYAVLIPHTLFNLSALLSNFIFKKKKVYNLILVSVIFIGFFLFLIRPAITHSLTGTLQGHQIPSENNQLEQFLDRQPEFFRTLWVPKIQQYGYYTAAHPSVNGYDYFRKTSVEEVLSQLEKPKTEERVQEDGIKYVIVPFDSEKSIFLTDRKYDEGKYQKTVSALLYIPWLQKLNSFGSIAVFEVTNSKKHFWSTNPQLMITESEIHPTLFFLHLSNARKGDRLVFTESYDPGWKLTNGSSTESPEIYLNHLNSFILPRDGTYDISLQYTPQQWVFIGSIISLLTLVGVSIALIYYFYFSKISSD